MLRTSTVKGVDIASDFIVDKAASYVKKNCGMH